MRTLGDLSWQYGIHFGTEILRVALKGDDLYKVKIMNDMVIHSTVITKGYRSNSRSWNNHRVYIICQTTKYKVRKIVGLHVRCY